MMAGVECNGVEHPRINKVEIIHAGEDLRELIRPLAVILEEQLKLGEQVEYRRHFKQDTHADVANGIVASISTGSADKGVVLVFGEKFKDVISKNHAASERIKTILSQERRTLKVALVTAAVSSVPFPMPSINLSNYITKLDDGAVAEAIYKQWFGPEARLSSQTETTRNGLANSDTAQDDYGPRKVKIIHALQDVDAKMHKRNLADAIDAVVDPEETTSSRIKFMPDQSIVQTVLEDIERFQCCCAKTPKVHAVYMWCKDMLNALKQNPDAQNRVVEILCRDTNHKKVFAHFLFGVTRQEMAHFSPGLWEFLTKQGHIVILESINCNRLADYMPFAQTFQRIWAGSMKVPKDPEESLDPTMNSLESVEAPPPPLTSQIPEAHPRQSHPHQNNTGDRLVINNGSMSHSDAVRTQHMGKALDDVNPSFNPQGRMVTSNGSWDPRLEKAVNYSREFNSDGHSNPPENWSHHTLLGPSLMENSSTPNREAAPVRQAMDNVDGKNRLAAGSIGSVSVDCDTGPKTTGMKILPTSSEPSDRGTYSLPPCGGQQRPVQQKSQQPSARVQGEQHVKNKVAPSGCMSWSVCGSSTRSESSMSQSGVDQPAPSEKGTGLRDLSVPVLNNPGQGDNLSIGDNPVRIVSDSDVLTSEDAHQLDDALSVGPTTSLRTELQSMASTDTTGSVGQSQHTSMPTMPPSSDVNNWSYRLSDGSQSVFRQSGSSDRVLSAPEGRNPLQDGAASTCGSVSLPYPGATSNAAQNRFPSGNGTNSVQSQAGSGFQEGVGQQTPENTLLSDLDQTIIRGLKIRLDPPKTTVADWQDLASNFGVDNVHITYWKGQKSDSSPFEQLLTWLKAEKQHLTVKDLKELLEKVKRRDVLRFLVEKGY